MDSLAVALSLLLMVESGDNADAKGDYRPGQGAQAIGCLQIWKKTVDDANRILGKKVYTYADRTSKEKSLEIARVILQHYGSTSRLGREATVEDYVRIWNRTSYRGESSGPMRLATDNHWRKAKEFWLNGDHMPALLALNKYENANERLTNESRRST